jgi:hypothetical protein
MERVWLGRVPAWLLTLGCVSSVNPFSYNFLSLWFRFLAIFGAIGRVT